MYIVCDAYIISIKSKYVSIDFNYSCSLVDRLKLGSPPAGQSYYIWMQSESSESAH